MTQATFKQATFDPESLQSQQVFEHDVSVRLQHAAEAARGWEVVPRPAKGSNGFTFMSRVRVARRKLGRLEAEMARRPVPEVTADPDEIAYRSALLEIGASHRLLRNSIAAVADRPGPLSRIPRVIKSGRAPGRLEEPRAAAIAGAYFDATDSVFDGPALTSFVQMLQQHEPLHVDELWELSSFLKFVLFESLLDSSLALFGAREQAFPSVILAQIQSLRAVVNTDWEYLIEPLIGFDAVLRQDPAQAYSQMDFESRERYRRRVALVARRCDCSEMKVAEATLELAREGERLPACDPRLHRRRAHVGYYLIDKGFAQLGLRTGFHPSLAFRAREFVRAHGEEFFLGGIQICALLFIASSCFRLCR